MLSILPSNYRDLALCRAQLLSCFLSSGWHNSSRSKMVVDVIMVQMGLRTPSQPQFQDSYSLCTSSLAGLKLCEYLDGSRAQFEDFSLPITLTNLTSLVEFKPDFILF
jgi:hypothetical protein